MWCLIEGGAYLGVTFIWRWCLFEVGAYLGAALIQVNIKIVLFISSLKPGEVVICPF